MAQEKQGNEVGSIAESRPGWLTRQLGDFKEWRKVIEAHPLKGAVLAIVLLVLGILGNEAVDRVMQNFREPDEFLVQMKDEQKQNFEALNASLSELKGTLDADRSEEHTSELQSLMRTSYAVFCLKQKKRTPKTHTQHKQ